MVNEWKSKKRNDSDVEKKKIYVCNEFNELLKIESNPNNEPECNYKSKKTIVAILLIIF